MVRYAKTITFKILLQDNKDQKIFVPYFNVDYAAQKSEAVTTTPISFSVKININLDLILFNF